ncbi:hypothetical protein RCL1_008667 [Eukaryota sp. TZLM3-RCL]
MCSKSDLLLCTYDTKGTPFQRFPALQYDLKQVACNKVKNFMKNIYHTFDLNLNSLFEVYVRPTNEFLLLRSEFDHLSDIFKSLEQKAITIINPLKVSGTVLRSVFYQGILKFKYPLVEFNCTTLSVMYPKRFCQFVTKLGSVSLYFRQVFEESFNLLRQNGGHVLVDRHSTCFDSLSSTQFEVSDLPNTLNLMTPVLSVYPITCLCLSTIDDLDFTFLDTTMVKHIHLRKIPQQFSFLSNFPDTVELTLEVSPSCIDPYLSALSCCKNLRVLLLGNYSYEFLDLNIGSLSLLKFLEVLVFGPFELQDVSPLSSLSNLTSLSFCSCAVYDLRPLKSLSKLCFLDLRDSTVSTEHRRIIQGKTEVKQAISCFENLYRLNLSELNVVILNLDRFFIFFNIKSLNLANSRVVDVTQISEFVYLEFLDLSNLYVEGSCLLRINDISFLSPCTMLKYLSLNGCGVCSVEPLHVLTNLVTLSLQSTKVYDLYPLKNLTKLSVLDVRFTFLPRKDQLLYSTFHRVQTFLSDFRQLPNSSAQKRIQFLNALEEFQDIQCRELLEQLFPLVFVLNPDNVSKVMNALSELSWTELKQLYLDDELLREIVEAVVSMLT